MTDVEDGLADRRDSFYSESLAHAVKGRGFSLLSAMVVTSGGILMGLEVSLCSA